MKHVIGPWRLDDLNDCHVAEPDGTYHCIAGGRYDKEGGRFNITGIMSKETAFVMSKAPQLVDALEAALKRLDGAGSKAGELRARKLLAEIKVKG